MKLRLVIYSVFVLLLAVPDVTAEPQRVNNTLPNCETLGYTKGGGDGCQFPLYCPFNDTYAICRDNPCHGYKEYDALIAEYGSENQLKAMCANIEECLKGGKLNTITTYRCAACKYGAFQAGRCLSECSLAEFPYGTKPADLYGTVVSCTGSDGKTRYGYVSCNAGWTLKEGAKCEMDIADRKAFPYDKEPPAVRGEIVKAKSATSTFYAYKSCKTGYSLKKYSSSYTTGSCIKSCTITCDSSNKCILKDNPNREHSDYCAIGDEVIYNNVTVGVLLYKAQTSSEKNLLMSTKPSSLSFGTYGRNVSLSKEMGTGKANTQTLLEVCASRNETCPAANYCYTYSVANTHPAFGARQWFLGSVEEMKHLANSDYTALFEQLGLLVAANKLTTSYSDTETRCGCWQSYILAQLEKEQNGTVIPILEF